MSEEILAYSKTQLRKEIESVEYCLGVVLFGHCQVVTFFFLPPPESAIMFAWIWAVSFCSWSSQTVQDNGRLLMHKSALWNAGMLCQHCSLLCILKTFGNLIITTTPIPFTVKVHRLFWTRDWKVCDVISIWGFCGCWLHDCQHQESPCTWSGFPNHVLTFFLSCFCHVFESCVFGTFLLWHLWGFTGYKVQH